MLSNKKKLNNHNNSELTMGTTLKARTTNPLPICSFKQELVIFSTILTPAIALEYVTITHTLLTLQINIFFTSPAWNTTTGCWNKIWLSKGSWLMPQLQITIISFLIKLSKTNMNNFVITKKMSMNLSLRQCFMETKFMGNTAHFLNASLANFSISLKSLAQLLQQSKLSKITINKTPRQWYNKEFYSVAKAAATTSWFWTE